MAKSGTARGLRKKIYHLIYDEKAIARMEIADRLGLSLVTVGQNLKKLEEAGLIQREGVFASTGGRQRQVISCVNDAGVAVGVELSRREVRMVAVDLYGGVLRRSREPLRYEDTDGYYRRFGVVVNAFCAELAVAPDRMLGIGIAIQGVPSPDGTIVTYGHILLDTGVKLEKFAHHLDYPARLVHDAAAAAYTELWFAKNIQNAIYLSLSQYLGGLLILNRTIHEGPDGNSALIEHMRLYPQGEECYCGRKGCFSVYCSVEALLREESIGIQEFFSRVRDGHPVAAAKWRSYLDSLALGIGNLRMVVSCDVILGGHAAPYLLPEDLVHIQRLIPGAGAPGTPFFVRLGHSDTDNVACGAALPLVASFLETVAH